jgi:lipopolysaccharide transport system ATP-binding protein
VRLAFAVAAHLEPDILLIDEVLAVGDAQFQEKCLGKMRAVGREGRTVLVVSHNTSTIASLCNSALFLEGGRLAGTDSLDDCIARYHCFSGEASGLWRGALGDGSVRVLGAEVRGREPGATLFTRGETFDLVIDYEVLRERPDFVIGAEVLNARGVFLCVNLLTDAAARYGHLAPATRAGGHRARLRVDTSLFAEGSYVIRLDVGIHNYRRIIRDEVHLRFDVLNPRKNMLHDCSDRHGVIYPDWAWSHERREAAG